MAGHPPLSLAGATNGIDATTGGYLWTPRVRQIAEVVRGQGARPMDPVLRRRALPAQDWGVRAGVNPRDLAKAGWGVIFPAAADPGTKDALSELLAHRRRQAGRRYRELTGEDGYRHGESTAELLARHGVGWSAADPQRIPYYLLLVGGPETIPYEFEYQLGVQYAVGRVYFETAEEYAAYAANVVAAESSTMTTPRVSFFGPQNESDRATELSSEHLVKPLHDFVRQKEQGWRARAIPVAEATKARLGELLDEASPGLLFLAGHGLGFPAEDPRQKSCQGALVCQDWPGPRRWQGPIPGEHYFAADDVDPGADLRGLVVIHFGCYSGGTPSHAAFHPPGQAPAELAPRPFVAALPQRLLTNPGGGALAVVAHVERTFGYSFLFAQAGMVGEELQTFESAVSTLVAGEPVGLAMEYFSQRYAALSAQLAETLEQVAHGKRVEDEALAATWTARNDARGYVLLGDPAARIGLADTE